MAPNKGEATQSNFHFQVIKPLNTNFVRRPTVTTCFEPLVRISQGISMNQLSLFPTPPAGRIAAVQRKSCPVPPTNTVLGELHQIRAHVESTRIRVRYLEDLLEPSVMSEVTDIKRAMKDTHRLLEKLQERIGEGSTEILMGEITVEAWQAYQRLVRLEERLKRTGTSWKEKDRPRPCSYVPKGAGDQDGQRQSSAMGFPFEHSWLDDDDDDEEASDIYMMSGALPYSETHAEDLSPASSEHSEDLDVDLTALPAFPLPPVHPSGAQQLTNGHRTFYEMEGGDEAIASLDWGRRLRRRSHLLKYLAKTRVEVKNSCDAEESVDGVGLHDPDGQREGSVSGFFATLVVLLGIDDSAYYLPKLRFIKVHEVRRLKEWLADKRYLNRSESISRMEKLLHLILLLQEGHRIETIAVLFSRTPRQVQDSCTEVFEGLLEMHSETALPRRQPACDHLWQISQYFFNEPEVVRSAERYYGWKMMDVVKVLVTINMYIARFRQQGELALDGPYLHWWRLFHDVEA